MTHNEKVQEESKEKEKKVQIFDKIIKKNTKHLNVYKS